MSSRAEQPRNSRVSRVIHAPREVLYRACLDPVALATWRVPTTMTGEMHAFDGREGGSYRMSLTYLDDRAGTGKSNATTDTFEGRFLELRTNERVVEVVCFDSDDPRFAGELRVTTTLADTKDGTEVTVLHEGLPTGVRLEDNEIGTAQALAKLAELVERDHLSRTRKD